jgi:hypothetical protein
MHDAIAPAVGFRLEAAQKVADVAALSIAADRDRPDGLS